MGLDLFKLIIDTLLDSKEDELPDDWEVTCQNVDCGWVGPISKCPTVKEQETWEMPEYDVSICPKCGEPIDP